MEWESSVHLSSCLWQLKLSISKVSLRCSYQRILWPRDDDSQESPQSCQVCRRWRHRCRQDLPHQSLWIRCFHQQLQSNYWSRLWCPKVFHSWYSLQPSGESDKLHFLSRLSLISFLIFDFDDNLTDEWHQERGSIPFPVWKDTVSLNRVWDYSLYHIADLFLFYSRSGILQDRRDSSASPVLTSEELMSQSSSLILQTSSPWIQSRSGKKTSWILTTRLTNLSSFWSELKVRCSVTQLFPSLSLKPLPLPKK